MAKNSNPVQIYQRKHENLLLSYLRKGMADRKKIEYEYKDEGSIKIPISDLKGRIRDKEDCSLSWEDAVAPLLLYFQFWNFDLPSLKFISSDILLGAIIVVSMGRSLNKLFHLAIWRRGYNIFMSSEDVFVDKLTSNSQKTRI